MVEGSSPSCPTIYSSSKRHTAILICFVIGDRLKILVTGVAGFIGSKLTEELLARGDDVVGIDNLNNYYDVKLKNDRLKRIEASNRKGAYSFYKIDIVNKADLDLLFKNENFDKVVNLAAQVGVKYSSKNPLAYVESNILGFAHILECCKDNHIKHLLYASSSSVYGLNSRMPFSPHDYVGHPISIYAASKRSNELMAHAYSHLFQVPTTGLRFFTVYGPWDRPDMALQKFAKAIFENRSIDVYHYGKHVRDFTYIDDIVEGIIRILDSPSKGKHDWSGQNPDLATSSAPWRVYNIGNRRPESLITYIETLENCLGKKAKKNLLPMQAGDMLETCADIDDLVKDFDFRPSTLIDDGIRNFANWYRDYYQN